MSPACPCIHRQPRASCMPLRPESRPDTVHAAAKPKPGTDHAHATCMTMWLPLARHPQTGRLAPACQDRLHASCASLRPASHPLFVSVSNTVQLTCQNVEAGAWSWNSNVLYQAIRPLSSRSNLQDGGHGRSNTLAKFLHHFLRHCKRLFLRPAL